MSLYIVSGAALPVEPLCSTVVFHFFGLISSEKMAVELSSGSSARVLKRDSCTNKSLSASHLCLLILSRRTARSAARPPSNTLIHSRRDHLPNVQEKAPVDG